MLAIIAVPLVANQISINPEEYPLLADAQSVKNDVAEEPEFDVELLDFEYINPDEKIDTESLNPPLWVVYLNKLTTPLFVLYNKIYKWFRVHPSVRTRNSH